MDKKKLFFTILISIIVFIGFIHIKNHLSYTFSNDDMGVRAVVQKGKLDTLFIGASGFRKGIDMKMIEEQIPGESFMLTYNGNEPLNMIIELEEIYNEGVEIGTLVVDFNPSMVDRGADLSDKRLLWDISMEGKRKLWSEINKESGTTLFTFFDYWISSNNDYMITYPIAHSVIAGRYYRGGINPSERDEGSTKEELDRLDIVEKPGINTLQKDSILKMVSLCNEHGTKILFLETPKYELLESNTYYKIKSDMLFEILKNEDVRVVRREDTGFDNTKAEYYTDLTHMSSKGREFFTKEIIKLL